LCYRAKLFKLCDPPDGGGFGFVGGTEAGNIEADGTTAGEAAATFPLGPAGPKTMPVELSSSIRNTKLNR
jgi:hypothetical protein